MRQRRRPLLLGRQISLQVTGFRLDQAQGLELAIEIQGTSHLPMQLGEDVWLGWAKKDIWVLKPGEA